MTDHTVAEPAPDAARPPARRALPPKPRARDRALPVGFRLYEYRIDAILGQGGFGIAYAATDVNLNASVVGETRLAAALVGAKLSGNITYFSKVTNREEIAGFAPLPEHEDWVVGVSESREYFAAPLDRLFRNVLWSVALVGAIFMALAGWFARSIVQPIRSLTSGAHALTSGDFDGAHIQVRSNDEVGQLARTFNVMIDVLRQRERERGGRRAVALGYEKENKK